MLRSLALAAFCSISITTVPATAAPPATSTKEVREAIGTALGYVRERGDWWIDEKGCVSCHRVALTDWTIDRAAAAGFERVPKSDNERRAWTTASLLEPADDPDADTSKSDAAKSGDAAKNEAKEDAASSAEAVLVGSKNLEGVAQVVWAQRGAKSPAAARLNRRLLDLLSQGQREDGSWKPGGQLPAQRRPAEETALVSTAWIALALGTDPTTNSKPVRDRALARLAKTERGVSTEWLVVRLLLAVQSGAKQETATWQARLLDAQRPVGGWGWLVDEEANAFGTGMAIYALRQAQLPADRAALQKAVGWLVKSQDEDGSWPVPGTKKKAKGRVVETATYWGTCWATLGLLATLEK